MTVDIVIFLLITVQKYIMFLEFHPQLQIKITLCTSSAPETAVCQDCHYRFIFSHDADGQKGVSCRKADQ